MTECLPQFNERAGDLSFGNLDVTVAIFRAVFQHLANPLGTFYKHLLLGGLKIIARYSHQSGMEQQYHIWCTIVTRRVRQLHALVRFALP